VYIALLWLINFSSSSSSSPGLAADRIIRKSREPRRRARAPEASDNYLTRASRRLAIAGRTNGTAARMATDVFQQP